MKVEVDSNKPEVKFVPVTLTITLESEIEVKALWHRMNAIPSSFSFDYYRMYPKVDKNVFFTKHTINIYDAVEKIVRDKRIDTNV